MILTCPELLQTFKVTKLKQVNRMKIIFQRASAAFKWQSLFNNRNCKQSANPQSKSITKVDAQTESASLRQDPQ